MEATARSSVQNIGGRGRVHLVLDGGNLCFVKLEQPVVVLSCAIHEEVGDKPLSWQRLRTHNCAIPSAEGSGGVGLSHEINVICLL